MSGCEKPIILLTNDDGVNSPGLWAAAEALQSLGQVVIVAPREQWSGAGRSMPNTSPGTIERVMVPVRGCLQHAYAVDGTPAQAVLHGLLEILKSPPALVVSGINYGENVGSGVTISGTVGAALEAASHHIPALAVSLETPKENHLTYSDEIDFSTAAYFTALFARKVLAAPLPPDVDLLKIDIPANSTRNTPWKVTRQSKDRYYRPVVPESRDFSTPGKIDYAINFDREKLGEGTDAYALHAERVVSITPMSLDLTSRIALSEMANYLNETPGKN